MRKIDTIILHCTATKETSNYTFQQLEKDHLKRGFVECGYHIYIRRDGTIILGRSIDKIGAHCSGHNTGSIGICYEGGLDANGKPKDTRTDAQKESMKKVVKGCMERFGIKPSNVYGHYMFAAKECPCFDVKEYRKELE